MSRYDDPSWHEEPEANASFSSSQAYDDLSDKMSDPWREETQAPDYLAQQQTREPKRSAWKSYLVSATLVVIAFCAGWFGHQQFGNVLTTQGDSSKYSQLFLQAWNTVDQNYVDREQVNYQQMSYAAIRAMVDALNDRGHTRFLTPGELQSETQSLSGKFIGIGVSLSQDANTKEWSISSTLTGSPAEKAGLKGGDSILSVDGNSITGKTYTDVSKLIQGKEGTSVTLSIRRGENTQPFSVKVVRAEIEVQNVTMHYIKESHIAHIQIAQFAQGISDQLKTQLEAAKKMGATRIILDLRNNTGGFLNEAINTTSTFVASGNVLLEQDSSGKRTPVPVNGNALDTHSAMVVLINGTSASASEIVSGSLRDNKRAILIGEKTFGTGTVLQQFGLSDGSALLIGTQEWLTPNGQFIRDKGIQPDLPVALGSKGVIITPGDENSQNLSESQLLHSNDPQLIEAINTLNAK